MFKRHRVVLRTCPLYIVPFVFPLVIFALSFLTLLIPVKVYDANVLRWKVWHCLFDYFSLYAPLLSFTPSSIIFDDKFDRKQKYLYAEYPHGVYSFLPHFSFQNAHRLPGLRLRLPPLQPHHAVLFPHHPQRINDPALRSDPQTHGLRDRHQREPPQVPGQGLVRRGRRRHRWDVRERAEEGDDQVLRPKRLHSGRCGDGNAHLPGLSVRKLAVLEAGAEMAGAVRSQVQMRDGHYLGSMGIAGAS